MDMLLLGTKFGYTANLEILNAKVAADRETGSAATLGGLLSDILIINIQCSDPQSAR